MSDSLRSQGTPQAQNTEVGSLSLPQGIFPTQGSNPGLPHSSPAALPRTPRILERVAYPFSSRSSRPRNQTGVSCIVGGFFTNWAIREVPSSTWIPPKFLSPAKPSSELRPHLSSGLQNIVRAFRIQYAVIFTPHNHLSLDHWSQTLPITHSGTCCCSHPGP